ncbi:bifunctional [glutamate--ammonia ligase]-adenylyl-L-tyrosine phosphorylase/[glutamate--ammonia-ligase] adenylyltransferase [Sansalvadorimonas sp. 2012CJ34-2]|uniref:Bifunctional glutamine synthetase adenylyltransferase/adenylyl-removing enzyme n=1 Tax=Parendozoicomonas callyspongiae TaxID=2942213 RepID=A0ABT0PAE0_9GAMM|nr:bifunctional [glutamate--ammonia ligase]-adenylyl-L-tyrosine phosphorylase/[glutamate--ammonia-ligase] adenylyltransferase [Sansalvadorimonas sp. 2012CJ34-2]MCL6268355.1 bifunctional [glutamate--ammonia ligase]-adenylyl-L-tyrosine phosphorylase/[glutamate--ammonia-ligase] adenylyltransferase [Sansalvadorimonas sp. 2012CJ34-2]
MTAAKPELIQKLASQRHQIFLEKLSDDEKSTFMALTPDTWEQIQRCWVGSDYVWDLCQTKPEVLLSLIGSGALYKSFEENELDHELTQLLDGCDSEEMLMSLLRQFRRKQQMRTIFRDLNRLVPMTETTTDVTSLADSCIKQACDWLYEDCCKTIGTPMGSEDGGPLRQQHITVLGMGKLGARELNLSSDIDLIFCYPSKGETQGAPRTLTNQEFFIRLGQRLIKVLDSQTVDGFVFRVDMRLRPYGQSGALALSFSAMEQYYQDQGRDWERYAMIKARVITGDKADGQELMDMLRPFVYRRYIDFGAISALRDMKRMIQREVARRSLQNNIKLGHGGIREIEFVVQSFQLIHGGRDRSLQKRPLLEVLEHLGSSQYLPSQICQDLREANEFLRNLEHALQAVADRQTQTLPSSEDDLQKLSWIMGFDSETGFLDHLNVIRDKVSQHFEAIISENDDTEQKEDSNLEEWDSFWSSQLPSEEELALLERMGFQSPVDVHQRLLVLRDGKVLKTARRQSTERIDQFMPRLLQAVLREDNPDQALLRVLTIVEAVLRRTAYLVLLIENPGALEHLVSLCAASPMITDQIARHPALLDEFLNLGSLYSPPEKNELEDELRQQLAHIPEDDLETQMESLRYFRMSHMLRVAAAQVAGKMPLMKESDYLTWTAESILRAVLDIAWKQLAAKHGEPSFDEGDNPPGFLIVGYGKLGGIEMGPGSDLDLVFIHNGNSRKMTSGEKPLENSMFFTRLGQRIVHMLDTSTISGQLYEVDMRLRPSGNSGLLVSSLTAFEKYQNKEAWTWEHQALVRARVVAGDPSLAQQFESVRANILSNKREQGKLLDEVREMREKMAKSLGTKATKAGTSEEAWDSKGEFHLKHDRGGIVDIEFLVQYAVLAWSHDHPSLTRWSDNIRILEDLEHAGLLSHEDAVVMNEAYQSYRKKLHKAALQNQSSKIRGDKMHKQRQTVIQLWNHIMQDDVPCNVPC